MAKFKISFTDAAKEATNRYAEEDKFLRLRVVRSGCCSYAISVYPDVERVGDEPIEIDGIKVLPQSGFEGVTWQGKIDYKEKGWNKGFQWHVM